MQFYFKNIIIRNIMQTVFFWDVISGTAAKIWYTFLSRRRKLHVPLTRSLTFTGLYCVLSPKVGL
jgi:hypothetical protein